MSNILTNLDRVKRQINSISDIINHAGQDVHLVVVTKTVPVAQINELVSYGITNLGESRVQELKHKYSLIFHPDKIKWHFIGHLQTNKVALVVRMVDLIQSVDSIRLATEINRQAGKINKIQDCLVEIKISDEPTKTGILPEQVDEFMVKVKELSYFRVKGVMAIVPYFNEIENTRPYFRRVKQIYGRLITDFGLWTLDNGILSMGMSHDFKIAIQEGANMVRIGSAIFNQE